MPGTQVCLPCLRCTSHNTLSYMGSRMPCSIVSTYHAAASCNGFHMLLTCLRSCTLENGAATQHRCHDCLLVIISVEGLHQYWQCCVYSMLYLLARLACSKGMLLHMWHRPHIQVCVVLKIVLVSMIDANVGCSGQRLCQKASTAMPLTNATVTTTAKKEWGATSSCLWGDFARAYILVHIETWRQTVTPVQAAVAQKLMKN